MNQLPTYLSWLKHIDMLFVVCFLGVLLLLFFTIAKNKIATSVTGIFFAFITAYFTPLLGWIPTIGSVPHHIVNIIVFALLTLLFTHFLFTNAFFEPMNVPTGKEVIVFSVVITGFFITLGLMWWPKDQIAQFSQLFQTLFVNNPARGIWLSSPAILIMVMRGSF